MFNENRSGWKAYLSKPCFTIIERHIFVSNMNIYLLFICDFWINVSKIFNCGDINFDPVFPLFMIDKKKNLTIMYIKPLSFNLVKNHNKSCSGS